MNITLFTYDRPHWKTQQFLYELVALGHTPVEVIGAPWREDLRLPSTVRMTCRHLPQHPAEVCRVLGIRYTVKPHADAGPGDLGVIGGARILPKDVVSSFSTGILNMHPGRIPDNRGLSNIARAMRDGLPQVVTAHLIDHRIDAGRVLFEQEVPEAPDDMLWDLGEKIMDTGVQMLGRALGLIALGMGWDVPLDCGGYEPPMTAEQEQAAVIQWHERKKTPGHCEM